VNVDVPLDVFAEDAPAAAVPDPREWWHEIDRRPAPSPKIARRALELLASAERPVMLVGNGTVLAEAAPEVRRLAELLDIPVANTPQGAGVMPADHRLALGSSAAMERTQPIRRRARPTSCWRSARASTTA
jgi:acetolactate synthase-1/2/3 large subunit